MRTRRQTLDEWASTVARWIGLAGLVAFAVVWIVTHRVEPLLVGAFGGLYGLGNLGAAAAALRQPVTSGPEKREA